MIHYRGMKMATPLTSLIDRIGLAFVFVSIGVWEVFRPGYWVGYLPPSIMHLADPMLMVRAHGVGLVLVGVAIVAGLYLRVTSALAGLMLLDIIVILMLQRGLAEIIIRDIGILFLAISTFASTFKPKAPAPNPTP